MKKGSITNGDFNTTPGFPLQQGRQRIVGKGQPGRDHTVRRLMDERANGRSGEEPLSAVSVGVGSVSGYDAVGLPGALLARGAKLSRPFDQSLFTRWH